MSKIIGDIHILTLDLEGKLYVNKKYYIKGDINTEGLIVEGNIETRGAQDWYKGAYEITPKVTSQTMQTNMKTMKGNVTIKPVPYYETSNEYGCTVYIADNINGD